MPILTIAQRKSKLMPLLPHYIFINSQMIGLMQKESVRVQLPEGIYIVRIQSILRWFYSDQQVSIQQGVENHLQFGDREKIWDLLFGLDIIGSPAKMFFHLPNPWNLIYSIFSNGYFVLWLIYEYRIRKRYFKTEFFHKRQDSETGI